MSDVERDGVKSVSRRRVSAVLGLGVASAIAAKYGGYMFEFVRDPEVWRFMDFRKRPDEYRQFEALEDGVMEQVLALVDEPYLSRVSWQHAVNRSGKLQLILADSKTKAIESDALSLDDSERGLVDVMAHEESADWDLYMDDWHRAVGGGRMVLPKIDHKNRQVADNYYVELMEGKLDVPRLLFLNADIFKTNRAGEGSFDPVEYVKRAEIIRQMGLSFGREAIVVLSPGLIKNDRGDWLNNSSIVEAMEIVSGFGGSVTWPMSVTNCIENPGWYKQLLENPRHSVTIYGTAYGYQLNDLVRITNPKRTFYDVQYL